MNDEKVSDMFIKLMDEIHQNTSALKDMLANHEARITVLERSDEKKEVEKGGQWRNDLLMLLAKAVVIGGVCIASLVGAGGLLQRILGGA